MGDYESYYIDREYHAVDYPDVKSEMTFARIENPLLTSKAAEEPRYSKKRDIAFAET